MRHKYSTRAIVLGRTPLGEESLLASLLTEEFGLVRARSQGARKKGSKMSPGLQTLSRSEVVLLRGKAEWRMAGALLEVNWARELETGARKRAARVLELADRLIRGEHNDPGLYNLLSAFLCALVNRSEEDQDVIETLTVVRLLQQLGVDAGETFGEAEDFSDTALEAARTERAKLIARINHGITISGL